MRCKYLSVARRWLSSGLLMAVRRLEHLSWLPILITCPGYFFWLFVTEVGALMVKHQEVDLVVRTSVTRLPWQVIKWSGWRGQIWRDGNHYEVELRTDTCIITNVQHELLQGTVITVSRQQFMIKFLGDVLLYFSVFIQPRQVFSCLSHPKRSS